MIYSFTVFGLIKFPQPILGKLHRLCALVYVYNGEDIFHRRAHDAAKAIAALPGFSLAHPQPFFNEFTVACPGNAGKIAETLEHEGVIAGLPLGSHDPSRSNDLLICVTETKSEADIARLVESLGQFNQAGF